MEESQTITLGSIKKRNKIERVVFIMKGKFATRLEFNARLKNQFDDEVDLRTIKFHDSLMFLGEKPQVITLDYLYEDLVG
jgi:hypothetical protein